jgi:phosphopantothenoylcysteine decarboxylase
MPRKPPPDPLPEAKVCESVVVVASGAVAAVMLPAFLFLVRRTFAPTVRVFLSAAARRFVTPYAVRVVTGLEPVLDLFEAPADLLVPHVEAVAGADLLVALPATANLLARAAHGLADDGPTAAILAASCPVLFVPAMNPAMWAKPAVRRNVARLRADGHHVLDPGPGFEVATMTPVVGAMPSFDEVLAAMTSLVPRAGRGARPRQARGRR